MVIETMSLGDRLSYIDLYEAWYRERGLVILDAAGVPTAMEQLAEEIRSEHPDVRLNLNPTITVTHGVVSVNMRWNFQGMPEMRSPEPLHDVLLVMARIVTQEVVIATNQGDIVLTEDQYRIPGATRLAIHQAYDHPVKVGLAR